MRKGAYSRPATLDVATGATATSAEHELTSIRQKPAAKKRAGSPDLSDTQILLREHNRNVAYKSGAQTIEYGLFHPPNC